MKYEQPNFSIASDEELLDTKKLLKKEMKRRGITETERIIVET